MAEPIEREPRCPMGLDLRLVRLEAQWMLIVGLQALILGALVALFFTGRGAAGGN